MERRGGRLASVDCRTKNQTKFHHQHGRCRHHHNHIIATLLKFHPQRGCYSEVRYCIFIMTTIREEMWVKKHFLRPVFYHDFPENMMKTRFQTQSSVVGSARRATTLSSASLRWNARRLDQDDHGDHLHQCGVIMIIMIFISTATSAGLGKWETWAPPQSVKMLHNSTSTTQILGL